jgi:hypothetical protein
MPAILASIARTEPRSTCHAAVISMAVHTAVDSDAI